MDKMAQEFKIKKDDGLPPFVNQTMVDQWQQQIEGLQGAMAEKVIKVQLPYYMNPENIDGARLLTEIQHRPLLRDAGEVGGNTLDVPTILCSKENLHDLLTYLRDNEQCKYTFLLDLTGVDLLNSPDPADKEANQGKRFQMHYQLRSLEKKGMRIRVIVPIDEAEEAPSITNLWVGANWPEREVYDLMGIKFSDHPDLRRILMPDEYRGHPLRKDFPIQGIGEDYLIDELLAEHEENI